jgi:hypothetical protein
MKKIVLIILVFLQFAIAESLELKDLFRIEHFNYRLNAYNGGNYHPSRINKQYQYLGKIDLRFGWHYSIQNNVRFWIDLSYKEELFDKQILLESTGFSYTFSSWELYYLLSNLEYGTQSRIMDLNVVEYYFNKPILLDYRFQGLKITKHYGDMQLTNSVGGNSFNSIIINSSVQLTLNKFIAKLLFFFSGRNDYSNERSCNFGLELVNNKDSYYFYTAVLYTIQTESETERFDSVQEMIFYPVRGFYFGSNLIYSIVEWEKGRNWRSRSIIGLDYKKITSIFSYEYQNSEGYMEHWGNRKYNLVTNFNLNSSMSVGLDLWFMDPTYDDKYYQVGLQGKFEYATD